MEKNKSKLCKKLNEDLLFDSRNTVAFMGFASFGTILGLLAYISAFFLIGVKSNVRTTYLAVIAPLIFLTVLALLLFIRFYKKSTVIKTKKKYLLVNQLLTYAYLVFILGWVVVVMLQSKYYGALDKDLLTNMHIFIMFRYIIYIFASIIIALTIAQLFYNLYIFLKKNTKETFEDLEKRVAEAIKKEESKGELVSEVNDSIKEEKKEVPASEPKVEENTELTTEEKQDNTTEEQPTNLAKEVQTQSKDKEVKKETKQKSKKK